MVKCVRPIHTNELHGLYFLVTNVSDKMEVNLIWMMLKVYLIIIRMN